MDLTLASFWDNLEKYGLMEQHRLFDLGGTTVSLNYIQIGLLVAMIFLIGFTLARFRHLYLRWSFSSSTKFMIMGAILVLVVEAVIVFLSGELGIDDKLKEIICKPMN